MMVMALVSVVIQPPSGRQLTTKRRPDASAPLIFEAAGEGVCVSLSPVLGLSGRHEPYDMNDT